MSSNLSLSPSNGQLPLDSALIPTNPAWRALAIKIIKRLAKRRQTITSADVINQLAKSDITTSDLRAIGAVMREGATLGLIENSGLVRQQNNKRSRGATTLWKSRIYQQSLASDTNNS